MDIIRSSELFSKILQRPALYVGHSSIIRIKAFLDGYGSAIRELEGEWDDPLYDGFQQYIVNRFGFGHHRGWDSIIAFMGISESNAFEMTKELW